MYQALYRKYRPSNFDELCGQEKIAHILKRQAERAMHSHAYLFIGSRGTGKTSCARILAKALNCTDLREGNPCNACSSCHSIDRGEAPDVVEIDAASHTGVDNIRAIREEAMFSPAELKLRVYIIDEVHMLSASAFNALLKIMEEPPSHLVFVLATTELRKVPATILSRCQRYTFGRLTTSVIADRLRYVSDAEGIEVTDEALSLIARLAEGAMRDALSVLDQCSMSDVVVADTVREIVGIGRGEELSVIAEHLATNDAFGAVTIFSQLWSEGRDPVGVLTELASLLRDILLVSIAPEGAESLLSGVCGAEDLGRLGKLYSEHSLLRALSAIQKCLTSLREAPSTKAAVELCLIGICVEDSVSESVPEREVSAVPKQKKVEKAPEISPAKKTLLRLMGSQEEQKPQQVKVAEPVEDVPWYTEADAPPPKSVNMNMPEPEPIPEPEPVRASEPVLAPEPPVQEAAPIMMPESGGSAEPEAAWRELLKRVGRNLGSGHTVILSDAASIRGELSGGVLTLGAKNDFAYNFLNSGDFTATLEALIQESVGEDIKVHIKREQAAQGVAKQSIDDLRKFSQVKFSGGER